jgi:hypothetical protein
MRAPLFCVVRLVAGKTGIGGAAHTTMLQPKSSHNHVVDTEAYFLGCMRGYRGVIGVQAS